MKNLRTRKSLKLLFAALLLTVCTSCNQEKKSTHPHEMNMGKTAVVKEMSFPEPANLVEVKTTGMNFILPDTIASGWTSFRYTNESTWEHFMLIDKLPVVEGKQIIYDDFEQVTLVFNDAMNLINKGQAEKGFAEFSRLPSWFSKIIFSGGVGIISPGETAQTTVYVEPGTYLVECYVKTEGIFHPMKKQVIVKESAANEVPPTAQVNLNISKDGGIEMKEEPVAGLQTIAVHFVDQGTHEHFLGHDVHLVKLEKDADLEALNSWMTWTTPEGLNTPAPVRFLGGAQEMPAGKTAYITVNLEPGNYAWISEVPNPASKNMLKRFSVSESTDKEAGGKK
ncbi:MAG TPA: hypothetical protein VFM60_03815 [Salinimicrobium sp.]|nr:hypothetical protein [Salinimicrobium sp.]